MPSTVTGIQTPGGTRPGAARSRAAVRSTHIAIEAHDARGAHDDRYRLALRVQMRHEPECRAASRRREIHCRARERMARRALPTVPSQNARPQRSAALNARSEQRRERVRTQAELPRRREHRHEHDTGERRAPSVPETSSIRTGARHRESGVAQDTPRSTRAPRARLRRRRGAARRRSRRDGGAPRSRATRRARALRRPAAWRRAHARRRRAGGVDRAARRRRGRRDPSRP